MNRRTMLARLAALAGASLLFGWSDTGAGPRRRRHRRRVRRRIRRRHRRRVFLRTVRGRRVWVVPVGLAIGWELVHDGRVVVVKQTKIVERDGAKVEIAVVQHGDGKAEEVEIVRENTPENAAELEGSVLPDDDATTPAVEAKGEETGKSKN